MITARVFDEAGKKFSGCISFALRRLRAEGWLEGILYTSRKRFAWATT